MNTDEARRLTKREVCLVYDVPPWMISPAEPGERWWWYRTWPWRQWRKLKGRWRAWTS